SAHCQIDPYPLPKTKFLDEAVHPVTELSNITFLLASSNPFSYRSVEILSPRKTVKTAPKLKTSIIRVIVGFLKMLITKNITNISIPARDWVKNRLIKEIKNPKKETSTLFLNIKLYK